jgi:hypothetical protein
MKKTVVLPTKEIMVDTGKGVGRERYVATTVPVMSAGNTKWRCLDAQRGYFDVDGDDVVVSPLPDAPAMTEGSYAKAFRNSDGKVLVKPVFLKDVKSQNLGTIESEGKVYLQGTEYHWEACDVFDPDAFEINAPVPVNDGTCITPMTEGIPADVGKIDVELGIPESAIIDKAKLLGLVEKAVGEVLRG